MSLFSFEVMLGIAKMFQKKGGERYGSDSSFEAGEEVHAREEGRVFADLGKKQREVEDRGGRRQGAE